MTVAAMARIKGLHHFPRAKARADLLRLSTKTGLQHTEAEVVN
jgi:hypothetical protein